MILSRSQKRKSSESVHHIRGQNKNKWAKVSSTRILGVAFIPAVSYPGDSRHTAIQFVLKCRQKKRRKTLVEKNSDEDWSTNNLEQREECIKRDSKSILLDLLLPHFAGEWNPSHAEPQYSALIGKPEISVFKKQKKPDSISISFKCCWIINGLVWDIIINSMLTIMTLA